MSIKNILLIPHLRIHNANALSSPYTIGFPSITAWLGAAHALQRKLKELPDQQRTYKDLHFKSVGIACHDLNLQTYRGNAFISSIIGTGNPLDKSGNRPSFIEEARCHLDVSLVIEFQCRRRRDLENHIDTLLKGNMKIAGGDIMDFGEVQMLQVDTEKDNEQRKLMGKLMPSYCIVERRDLMQQTMQDGQDGMDAILDYSALHHHCKITKDQKVEWTAQRRSKGWIVPIAVGFQGISDLAQAKNQRDATTPHRFAESLVTLGEFLMPYRIENIDNMLWHYHYEAENNLYLCKQNTSIIDFKES